MYRDKYFALFLFGFGALVLFTIGYIGREYYFLSLPEKYQSDLHHEMGPSGRWGHGLGIIGSVLMLLNFLYSWRKRNEFNEKFGRLKTWLEFHMFVGLFGPTLILYHSAFKLQGIVAVVCFVSMIIVVVSGIIGRYIYVQIPRHINGAEFNLAELKEREEQLTDILTIETRQDPAVSRLCQDLCQSKEVAVPSGTLPMLMHILKAHWRSRRQMQKLIALLQQDRTTAEYVPRIRGTVTERLNLARKITMWKGAHRLLDTWRFLHKKLSWLLFITLAIHILVTLLFGFTWIF
jgi:hypothetical protein